MSSRDLLRLKTVRNETAQGIADALRALGYPVHHRRGPIGLGHLLADSNTYEQLKSALDSLIMDDERWTGVHKLEMSKAD
jgi:hypothetical protein